MALQLSVDVQNARLNAIESAVGLSPKLQIRSGAVPANCAAPASGTLLAEIQLPADYLTDASNGSKLKNGVWSATGVAAGTAGHFRVVDSGGVTCHLQGTITMVGDGGDMTVDNTSIAVDQTITVNSFTLVDGNG